MTETIQYYECDAFVGRIRTTPSFSLTRPSLDTPSVLVHTDPHTGVTSVEFYFDGGEWTEYVAPYSMAGGTGEDYLYPSPYFNSECGPQVVLLMSKSGSTVLVEEELLFELAGGEDFELVSVTIREFGMWPESCPCHGQVRKYSLV